MCEELDRPTTDTYLVVRGDGDDTRHRLKVQRGVKVGLIVHALPAVLGVCTVPRPTAAARMWVSTGSGAESQGAAAYRMAVSSYPGATHGTKSSLWACAQFRSTAQLAGLLAQVKEDAAKYV